MPAQTRSSLRGPSLWLLLFTCVAFTVVFMSTMSTVSVPFLATPFKNQWESGGTRLWSGGPASAGKGMPERLASPVRSTHLGALEAPHASLQLAFDIAWHEMPCLCFSFSDPRLIHLTSEISWSGPLPGWLSCTLLSQTKCEAPEASTGRCGSRPAPWPSACLPCLLFFLSFAPAETR